jgi:hypothetical protein
LPPRSEREGKLVEKTKPKADLLMLLDKLARLVDSLASFVKEVNALLANLRWLLPWMFMLVVAS